MRAKVGPPLRGLRILVTRPRGQVRELASLLRGAGARVLAVPAIRIGPPADPGPLRDSARRFLEGAYQGVVFTSPNGVERFFKAVRALDRVGHRRWGGKARFSAIGPKTAEALRGWGIRGYAWPAEHRAEALAANLRFKPGIRILLPRAAVAREVLPRTLRKRGARVEVVEAYRTFPEASAGTRLRRLLLGKHPPDWVTFTSSSTVDSLRSLFSLPEWRQVFTRTRAACIGPITARTLAETGVRRASQASPYTARGLAQAIRSARLKETR